MTSIRALLERYGRLPRWLRLASALAWAALIWWLSSIPAEQLPEIPVSAFIRNGFHVVLFTVLGALLFLAWSGPLSHRFAWSVGLSAIFGIVDEIHQASVPGRMSSVADAFSNGLGAVLGCCLFWWLHGRNPRAARALPWVLLLALGSVSLATFAGL